LHLKKKRDILAALPFQLESLLPFAPEETIAAPFLLERDGEGTRISFYATTQRHVETHKQEWEALGVHPDQVGCVPAALARAARFLLPQHPSLYFLQMSGDECCSMLLSHGKTLFAQAHAASEADRMQAAALRKSENAQEVAIAPSLGELTPYALPIGLALDALSDDAHSVHLLLKGAKQRKKMRRFSCLYAALCSALALLTWSSTTLLLQKRETHLYTQLRAWHDDAPSSFYTALQSWEQSVRKQGQAFPYAPTVPSVSDLLAYLSTHPQLHAEEPGEHIFLQRVHYTLDRYPKIDGAREPYEAKVSIDLAASAPRLARAFHEALRRGDVLVDARRPITWEAGHNTYTATFYLKKTSW
jgi:hypothetical protein